jgi:hypothetical protein
MANTFEIINKVILTSAQSSVSFTSIPTTYTDLVLLSSYRGTHGDIFDQMRITFNGTNNWSFYGVYGAGTSGSAGTEGLSSQSSGKIALGVGSTATANTFSNNYFYISNYLSSVSKSISSDVVGENNANSAFMGLYANLNATTAAVNSITLVSQNSANFVSGSSFYLYGISKS